MPPPTRIPAGVKIGFTAFMAVMLPVYFTHYGWRNFLWFCDIAMILTLVGIWRESRLLISAVSAGILVPQMIWCVDFAVECTGHTFTTMTSYMFEKERPLFLRILSSFHGWLPFLLLYLIRRLGYVPQGWKLWTGISTAACLASWFFVSPPSQEAGVSRNLNFVYGFSETTAQTWMHPVLYLCGWLLILPTVIYWPTHLFLTKYYARRAA